MATEKRGQARLERTRSGNHPGSIRRRLRRLCSAHWTAWSQKRVCLIAGWGGRRAEARTPSCSPAWHGMPRALLDGPPGGEYVSVSSQNELVHRPSEQRNGASWSNTPC